MCHLCSKFSSGFSSLKTFPTPNSYTGLGDLHQCRPPPPPSVWGLCPPQGRCAQVTRLLTVPEHSRHAAAPDLWYLLSAREAWPPGAHRAYSLASSPASTFTQASPLRGGLPWPPGPKTATAALIAGHRIILINLPAFFYSYQVRICEFTRSQKLGARALRLCAGGSN